MKSSKAVLPLTLAAVSLLFSGCLGGTALNPPSRAEMEAQLAAENARWKAEAEAKGTYWYRASADRSTLLEIEKNPERWAGSLLSFDGEVMWVRETDRGTTLQVMVGNTVSLIVVWPQDSMPGVVKGSTVGVLGNVAGGVTGTNAFGARVDAIKFDAHCYVVKLSVGEFQHTEGSLDGLYLNGDKELFDKWKKGTPPF